MQCQQGNSDSGTMTCRLSTSSLSQTLFDTRHYTIVRFGLFHLLAY